MSTQHHLTPEAKKYLKTYSKNHSNAKRIFAEYLSLKTMDLISIMKQFPTDNDKCAAAMSVIISRDYGQDKYYTDKLADQIESCSILGNALKDKRKAV